MPSRKRQSLEDLALVCGVIVVIAIAAAWVLP